MEELDLLLENLPSGATAEEINHVYQSLSKLEVNKGSAYKFHEKTLPKVMGLIKEEVIKKDILYLSLIASNNYNILESIIQCENENIKFNLEDGTSLFNYGFSTKKHWFAKVIEDPKEVEKIFEKPIFDKVVLLKCIQLTNKKINVEEIEQCLDQLKQSEFDEFWNFYCKQIERVVNLVQFLKKINSTLDDSETFTHLLGHTLLETLSRFSDLQNPTNWDSIVQRLKSDTQNGDQAEIFTSFTILASVFEIIDLCNGNDKSKTEKIGNKIEYVKRSILSLKNQQLLLELLENIFSMIFLKNNHITTNTNDEEYFLCQENEIRSILYLLKYVFEDIKNKNTITKEKEDFQRCSLLNKYLSDALWRLDLITNVKKSNKIQTKMLQYMLAPPESLIQMCLKDGDFERAYQVIEIFNIYDTSITQEIKFTEKCNFLKAHLKRIRKFKELKKTTPNIAPSSNCDQTISAAVEEFHKQNLVFLNQSDEDFLNQNAEKYPQITHFQSNNEVFMNTLDLAITQCLNLEENEVFLQLAYDFNSLNTNIASNYSTFCKKLFDICKEVCPEKRLTIPEVLLEPNIPLNLEKHRQNEDFNRTLENLYEQFMIQLNLKEKGVLNNNHPTHKIILKMNQLCNKNSKQKSNVRYLSKMFNYLKAFSKVLYIEQNTSNIVAKGMNCSFFELLNYNRSELMGKLLFEINLDPSEFEIYFGKLKLDYLYHVVGNCFPTINLHTEETITAEELYPEHHLYVPTKGIINYIQKRNWLLAFVLCEMHSVENIKIDEARVKTFLNYKNLPKIKCLKPIFDNNEIITTLQNEINTQKIKTYINKNILKHEEVLDSSQISNQSSFETAEEILEGEFKSTDWNELYGILQSLPENQQKHNKEIIHLNDMVLSNLVHDGFEIEFYKYVQFISNRDLRIDTIFNSIHGWPGEFCVNVIKSELSMLKSRPNGKLKELLYLLAEISLCKDLKIILNLPNWSKCYREICTKKDEVFEKLLATTEIDLLIKIIELHKPSEENLKKINEDYIIKIFKTNPNFNSIQTLLDFLPQSQTTKICTAMLSLLRKLDHLKFTVNYLSNLVSDGSLTNIQISLKMLEHFTTLEQEQLLCLINTPLNIIEVLIMNTKLDKLSVLLNMLKTEVMYLNDEYLSIEQIDEILRHYAEKSLDFRVITQPSPRLLRTPECKLMQSFDSLNLGSDKRYFIMPDVVPTKDEWVPNTEVLECLCCQNVVFSMFNRRHHCRRCGRVICYNCSRKRMQVPTYGDILVRVCNDCYEQTIGDSISSEKSDSLSAKSVYEDFWLLTDDEEHNIIVRDEFSFEHAPSVSLCLSILKYHSKSSEYPKFLLDQCNEMLKLLQPTQEPIQEIDYMLVIKMLRSLAIAAKVLSQDCGLPYGTSLADRILSQADLLGLLAERGCLSLLPINTSTSAHAPYIDASILRRLRDKLMEREQWNLALEVSTKAGLDNTGVFAAWGKSCLKAGSLTLAREKFQRCFDKKGGHYEPLPEDPQENRPRFLSKISNVSSISENKPAKNPPLLNEIIYILESKTETIDQEILDDAQSMRMSGSVLSLNQSLTVPFQVDTAVCILNKLKNLNNVAAGNYSFLREKDKNNFATNRPGIDPVFYEECIYYLNRYGTYLSLMEFYVKHGEIHKTLNFIVDNKMSSELFIEIYMRCLKDGIVNILQENMSKMDSTLDIWKGHLRHICRHLEKQGLLNSLYQLQQFMGDYIRAAMTCIRFYQENAKSFTDLCGNVNFLHKAEEHLKQVQEQEQWVEVASVRKVSEGSKTSYEEKSITNPSLVMKMDSRKIDNHINTIWRQNEVASFLAGAEAHGYKPLELLPNIIPPEDSDASNSGENVVIPTLFGSTVDKIRLAVLTIITTPNIEGGFSIATRIIEEFKIKPIKICNQAGKQLAKLEKFEEIAQLVSCIKSSSDNDKIISDMCDEMLTLAVVTLTKANASGTKVEDLIKLISDKATKISAYIEAGQLKSAYILAVRYKRISDIRRILREAELNNEPNIKALCQRVLQSHSHAPAHSKQ